METFSALLAICAGNSPVTGEFPAQRPVTRSFDIFFDLHLNKRLINRVKTPAISRVLTPLINTFWCVLYMITIKMLQRFVLIARIFYFRRCQLILWQQSMEPFDRAWFGCCPRGHIPSDDYGVPTRNSNDVTCSAVGLSQAATR